ncbi:MAG: 4-alpha-glucanotransferase [Deltaproteobacteria bacterium]|nr:4-alpha-glucanotransferase [Deltaproteobacteria bacterium]MBW1923476.1 4-alpha-glucanotransferase [Deltaproteobacteria bacterium]MBW1948669.1 4-alpha-glucanotransferase [Deltaproteobacteria bacterium]MBW2007229.1 4-alpha-glucanotransferase [Deltaproteobacteria bacterium]MBW2101596.1 4-alpha-glucanotransferase [Deltaproteobacteria bacterium]
MDRRASGALLHVTSLPSPYGLGDFGPGATWFADFLARTRQHYWQILPLNPTRPEAGHSPYHSPSAFAFNPLLISPEFLARDGVLAGGLDNFAPLPPGRVDYGAVSARKGAILERAARNLQQGQGPLGEDYERFRQENAGWLDDYALFTALKAQFEDRPWASWDPPLRDRDPGALREAARSLSEEMERIRLLQYMAFRQWRDLRAHCNARDIRVIGDMPIYVVYESADTWVHPEIFHLDEAKRPVTVAGVPPDYFSETGQLWGNPVYRWDVLREQGFSWWIDRLRHNLGLYDLVRIDHFRGFVGYWAIPASEKDAVNGRWVSAPGWDFFRCITGHFERLPIIAEDLGIITPDVVEVIRHFQFPGMKVLLFAFGSDLPTNPYAPHNLDRHCVLYTGTHDNNTARGWFEQETSPEDRDRLQWYLGKEVHPHTVGIDLIRLAMMSVADTVIFPVQDLLCLGPEARMNRPATRGGNWEWRLDPAMLNPAVEETLRRMTEIYRRA